MFLILDSIMWQSLEGGKTERVFSLTTVCNLKAKNIHLREFFRSPDKNSYSYAVTPYGRPLLRRAIFNNLALERIDAMKKLFVISALLVFSFASCIEAIWSTRPNVTEIGKAGFHREGKF